MISFGLIKLIKKHWFRFKLRKASPHDRAELMRNKFYFLGKNVELYTMNFGTEPYLISIHDNAVCASGISRKTKCSTFAKHFVPKSHLLTQFKM